MQNKNLLVRQIKWLQTFWQYQLFYWRHNSKCLQNMNTIWQLFILLFFLTVRNVREAQWNKTFGNSPCCKSSRRLLVELSHHWKPFNWFIENSQKHWSNWRRYWHVICLTIFFFLNILFYLNIISLYKLCWLVGRLPSKYLMYYFWYS